MAGGLPKASSLRSESGSSFLGEGIVLEIQAPNYPPRKVYIKSPRCSIGSAPDCTLRLVAPGVEPIHCVLIRSDRQLRVERVGPSTWLNHREFHTAPFQIGDRLQVGPIQIQLLQLLSQGVEVTQATSRPGGETSQAVVQERGGREIASSSCYGVEVPGEPASTSGSFPTKELSESHPREDLSCQQSDPPPQRLINLLQQARQEIDSLHNQIEQLRKDFDVLQTLQVSLRSLEEQAAQLENRSYQVAEWESRLTRQQSELEAHLAHLEAQYQALQRQWSQWQAEQAQIQQEIRRQQQTLQQQLADLRQGQQTLQTQLQELQTNQNALRDQQLQYQQAFQAYQEQAAKIQQELAAWEQRLQTQAQAFEEQQAALAQQNQALQHQRQLLEQDQQQWEAQKAQQQDALSEARVSEERIQRYTRPPESRSGCSAEEILRRVGMMPNLEEEEEPEDGSGLHTTREPALSQPPSDGPDSKAPDSSEGEDGVVRAYLERLLGQGWNQAAPPAEGQVDHPQGEKECREKKGFRRQPIGCPKSGGGKMERSMPRPTAEWVPRTTPPEKGVDLEAMRDLANLSAHTALEQHHRRKTLAAVWAKFFVSLVSLLLGIGMLWLWGGKPEHDLALYAAGTCFAVAALWGLQYLLGAGKLLLRSFGIGRFSPLPVPPPPQADSLQEGSSGGSGETCLSAGTLPPTKGD